jgi:hypothetical protein
MIALSVLEKKGKTTGKLQEKSQSGKINKSTINDSPIHLQPLAHDAPERRRQVLHVRDDRVQREGKFVDVLFEHGLSAVGAKVHRLHVQDGAPQDDKGHHDPRPADVQDGLLQRVLLVDASICQNDHELLRRGALALALSKDGIEACQDVDHGPVVDGVVRIETHPRHDRGAVGRRKRDPHLVKNLGCPRTEPDDAEVADVQPGHGVADEREGLEGKGSGRRLGHGFRVVDRQEHLVSPLVRLGSAHPDFVPPEVAGNVANHPLHVDPLSRAILSPELAGERGLEDETQLLRKLRRQRRRQLAAHVPDGMVRRRRRVFSSNSCS